MSDPDLHARASALFLELRSLPPPERAAALAARTAGDDALRREVESLLAHDDAPATAGPEATGGRDPSAADAPAAPAREPAGAARAEGRDPLAGLPARIGPYRVLGRLGHGGSGQVLLAEQDEPLRRRVAIKVVPAAALSPELAARFEVERRALEATEHPHVARILDAGRTDDGLPYLVMDLVEGEPITTACRGLPLVERLRLALPVADALQHAHQRGLVHRDVKPANVLVAERDGRPFPIVLDFGIAKPVAGALADESPPTRGLPLGTPDYMAPEQTGTAPVDVRADVYGLGAVLYELVTGGPPISARRPARDRHRDSARDAGAATPGGAGNSARIEAAGSDPHEDPLEALRRVREEVPPPASSHLAADAGSAPRALLADLDAILARALEKSPERRYPTMDALAADLRRLLAREPIEARAPTAAYRLARFAERNRGLVAAGCLAVLALLVGLAGLGWGLREARRERLVAEREELTQREINRFLTEDLLLAATPDELGADVRAADLLARASERLEGRFPTRPLVTASIHQTLADAYAELGDYDAAERHVTRALELRRANAGADSAEALRSEIFAADLLVRREQYEQGRDRLVPLVARARLVLGPDDPELYTALNDLGVALESLGDLDGAAAALEESLVARRRLLPPHHRDMLTSMANLALVRERQGDIEGSIAMLEDAIERAESAPEPPRFTLLALHNNLGATYQDLNRDHEAVPHLRRAAELVDETLGPDHPATISIRLNLAGLEAELGDPLRAAELYEEVIAYRTELLGPDAEGTLAARYGYWEALRKSERRPETPDGFAELLDDAAAALGETHWLTAQTATSLAYALDEVGRTPEALPVAERAAALMRSAYGSDHPRAASAVALFERLRDE